jgi:hypothetical protein
LACGACRAEARAAAAAPAVIASIEATLDPRKDASCSNRSRGRRSAGPHRHREPSEVRALAARVADLERRLQELRPGF